jgi:hypothetical protein
VVEKQIEALPFIALVPIPKGNAGRLRTALLRSRSLRQRSDRVVAVPYPMLRPPAIVISYICVGNSGSRSTGLAFLGTPYLSRGTCFFKLAIAFSKELLISAGQLVSRRDVADRAVKAYFVLAADVAFDETCRVVHREWSAGPDALRFECAVPALDLAVALRIVRQGSHVGHAADADELLEVTSYDLRAIVTNDPGMDVRVPFPGALNDGFDVSLPDVGPDLPVHDGTAEAIEQAA